MSRQNKEIIEDEINRSENLSALSHIADSDDTPSRLRSFLLTPFGIHANTPVSLFSNLDNESALTTDETLALKQIAIRRRKEVLARHILTQISALVPEVIIYALAVTSPTDYNRMREILSTDPRLIERDMIDLEDHVDDEILLTTTALNEIYLAAITARKQIIKDVIENTIQRMTVANLELLNGFLNDLDDNPAHIRIAIETNRTHLGNRSVIARVNDDSLLADDAAQAIRLLAMAKRKELLASKLQVTLQNINHLDQRVLLTEFTNPAATDESIRAHINANKAASGLPATTPDLDNNLLDTAAITALKPIAIQKLNSITVKQAILNLNFADIAIAREFSTAATPDVVRGILARNEPQLGGALIAAPLLVTNDDAEALRKLAAQQVNSLTIKHIIETLNDQAALGEITAVHTHAEICTIIQAHAGIFGITAVAPPEDLLSEEQAPAIQQAAAARITDLQKISRATTITTAINGIMNPTLLDVFDTAVTAQEIRQVLHDNNLHFGHIDLSADIAGDSLLTERQALDIKLAAQTRAASIVAEQTQRGADVITAIRAVNNPGHLVGIVAAIGEGDIRIALHARWGDLGLLNPVAEGAVDFMLTAQQTMDIQTEAITKIRGLNIQGIQTAIAGITDTTNPTLNAIAHINKAATGDTIRGVLTTHRANLGNIDVSTDGLLTDDAAKDIRTAAIQHFNTLLIKKTVADYTPSDPAIFEKIAKANYGDADAIRDAIRACRSDFGGAALISTRPHTADFLSNAQAVEMQILVIQKYNDRVIKQALEGITYSNGLDDLIAVPPDDANAIRRALDTDKAYFGNIDLSQGQHALSDEEAKAIHALARQKHAALVAKPIHRANVLMEKRDSLLHFTEEKVKAGEDPSSALTSTAGIAASQTRPGATIYEGQYLDKEHKIVSRRTFDVPSAGTTPATEVVGTLEQDHTGKVTDVTEEPDKLKESDRALLALKQAQMLLTNYTPGSGDIVISGTDVAQANKVYAALLYLKDKNPLLESIKIKSFVYGCNGPTGWIKSQANSAFIKEHLKSLPRDILESVKRQTSLILPTVVAIHKETARKQSELDALTRAGNPTASIKAKVAELHQAELQEGKEVSTGRSGTYKKS